MIFCLMILFFFLLWMLLYQYVGIFFFFFFKQKTAYEMRISDWSSDVCSSDLFISTATAAWTVDQIKDAKLVLVPEAGHSLTRHHREGVAPIIRDFVLSHPI